MRAVGTGTHPDGYYKEGQVFDIAEIPGPDGTLGIDPSYQGIIDKGWARLLPPEENPSLTDVRSVAQAMVRGDQLVHPVEQQVADEIGNRAHAIVATGDSEAAAEEAFPANEDERRTSGVAGAPVAPRSRLSAELQQAQLDQLRNPRSVDEGIPGSGSDRGGQGDGANATEAAETYAREQGIDIATVRGTGADGRVTKDDVEAAVKARDGGGS